MEITPITQLMIVQFIYIESIEAINDKIMQIMETVSAGISSSRFCFGTAAS